MIPIIPTLVLLGLDFTLLPLNVYDICLPLTKLKNGKVVDSYNLIHIAPYPEVPEILKTLNNINNTEVLLIFRRYKEKVVASLLELFGWKNYFKYNFSILGDDTQEEMLEYLLKARIKSKTDFDEMILFANESALITVAEEVGIFVTHVHDNGLTKKIFYDALIKYDEKKRKDEVKKNDNSE